MGLDVVLDHPDELTGQAGARALALLQVADDQARTGDDETGEAGTRAALAFTAELGDPWLLAIAWTILGRLLVSRGDAVGAVEVLRTAELHAARGGITDLGWDPCPAELAEALLAVGDLDAAEVELDRLTAAIADRDRPHVSAVLPRVAAQLRAEREGPDERARELALASVAAEEALDARFELGRSLLVAGRLHRRARRKRDAQALLTRAVAVLDAAPAPVWAARARDELSRVGLRPGAPGTLTPTEARVAGLAATGRTNREIAAEVFSSPKTVEAVLSRVYRKLDVRSRVELVTALAALAVDDATH